MSNFFVVQYACVDASYEVSPDIVYASPQEFMEAHDVILVEGEHRTWTHESGEVVLEPRPIMVVPRLNQKSLRHYVMGIVDCHIVTSAQMEPSQVSLSFMPVMFGALQPSAEIRVEMMGSESPPEPPTPPEEPKAPAYPSCREKPSPPSLAASDKDMRLKWEWDDIEEKEWNAHLRDIEDQNEKLRNKYDTALEKWEAHEASIAAMRQEYAATVAAWETTVKGWKTQDVQVAAAEWVERHDRIFSLWGRDVGTLAGDVREGVSPRAINGHPLFYACNIIHPKDWERIRGAIDKEDTRRKEAVV